MSSLIPSKENEELQLIPDRKNEMPFFVNEFAVYDNYEIIIGDEDAWGNPEISIQGTSDHYKLFNPNTYPEHLYLEIAKIKIDESIVKLPNEKNRMEEVTVHRIGSKEAKNSLLKFCRKFGLLGISDRKYVFKRINEDAFTTGGGGKKSVLTTFKKDVINQEFINCIYRMKQAVNYLNMMVDEKITENEIDDLINIVNDELPFKQDRLQRKGKEFYPSVLFSALIDLAWWQLREALMRGVEYRKCKNDRCGNIFAVTHGNREYCPPYPNQKRSNCENAYNRRLKYKRLTQNNSKS
jgi:hypothetical protein